VIKASLCQLKLCEDLADKNEQLQPLVTEVEIIMDIQKYWIVLPHVTQNCHCWYLSHPARLVLVNRLIYFA